MIRLPAALIGLALCALLPGAGCIADSDASGQSAVDTDHSDHSDEMATPEMMPMMMLGMYGPYPMAREASGTSWQPDSTPMEGLHRMSDPWMTMLHGLANFIYDDQGGPRGDTKTFSNSLLMFMGRRELGMAPSVSA